MEVGSITTIVASIVGIIGGVIAIIAAIHKWRKNKQAIITCSLDGAFPRQYVEIRNNGDHVASELEIVISGCHAHSVGKQDLYPGETAEIVVAIDKDTRNVDVDCSWKDGRVRKQKYHRTLLSRD